MNVDKPDAFRLLWIFFSPIGVLCPSTHPYPCQKGAMCAKAPFKPIGGNSSDCDGKRLTEDSDCCPADNVIPCSTDGTIFRCKANPPGKSMFSLFIYCTKTNFWLHGIFLFSVINVISENSERNTFYLMDLRKECVRYVIKKYTKRSTYIISNISTVNSFRLTPSLLEDEPWLSSKENLSQLEEKAMVIQRPTFILSPPLRDGWSLQTYPQKENNSGH